MPSADNKDGSSNATRLWLLFLGQLLESNFTEFPANYVAVAQGLP